MDLRHHAGRQLHQDSKLLGPRLGLNSGYNHFSLTTLWTQFNDKNGKDVKVDDFKKDAKIGFQLLRPIGKRWLSGRWPSGLTRLNMTNMTSVEGRRIESHSHPESTG